MFKRILIFIWEIIKRTVWLIGIPFAAIFMMIPLFWLLTIPYWALFDRNLFDDIELVYFPRK